MNNADPSVFLIAVESAFEQGNITEQDRRTLIKDMSGILDNIEGNNFYERPFSIYRIHESLRVGNDRYQRIYNKNRIESEGWFNENVVSHREGDNPAGVEYFESGKIQSEDWMVNGVFSRGGDKPSRIAYYENGKVKTLTYNQLALKNGEATYIGYHPNGNKSIEVWQKTTGPRKNGDTRVRVVYYENGKVQEESYWQPGNNPRKVIKYDEHGAVLE